jgi:hypothetical protein
MQQEPLFTAVETPDGDLLAGEMIRVTGDQATVCFPVGDPVPFDVGAKVPLLIAAPPRNVPLEIRFLVTSRRDGDRLRTYEVDFLPGVSTLEKLELRRQFCRRAAVRVKPPEEEVVVVTLERPEIEPPGGDPELQGHGYQVTGRLEDLSADGLSIVFRRDARFASLSTDLITLRIELPTSREPARLAAWVKNRRWMGRDLRFGLAFEPAYTREFESQIEKILDYILGLHRESRAAC